ncbi:hypothetical protein E1508_08285 [Pseudomonas moraviensis]|nr:hypothetical protein E1508_08285 [Pseudomonas moraviensis]
MYGTGCAGCVTAPIPRISATPLPPYLYALIVPTLRVVTPPVTLCVTVDAERPWLHSHAERGNDQVTIR